MIDRQDERIGWDLEFRLPDGTVELVEVKGSKGTGPFLISKNELKQARDQTNYSLYFVYGLGGATLPRIARIPQLGAVVKEEQLVAASWAVDRWDELPYEEIPVSPRGLTG